MVFALKKIHAMMKRVGNENLHDFCSKTYFTVIVSFQQFYDCMKGFFLLA